MGDKLCRVVTHVDKYLVWYDIVDDRGYIWVNRCCQPIENILKFKKI